MAAGDRLNGNQVDVAFGAGAIASLAAPTAAEAGALTPIECAIVDGPATPQSGSTIDLTALCDTSSRQKAGLLTNNPITITLFREPNTTDPEWVLFDPATTGSQHLLIARGGWATTDTPTLADKCEAYEVEVMKRESSTPVNNEASRFMVELAVISVEQDAVIAA